MADHIELYRQWKAAGLPAPQWYPNGLPLSDRLSAMLLVDGPQATTFELARIMELEAENARLKAMLAMIDDGSHAAEPLAILPGADEAASDKTPVDTVVDLLDKRMIVTPDRMRLRKALDKADAPQGGRAGADAGLGRAIGRPAQFDVGHGTGR